RLPPEQVSAILESAVGDVKTVLEPEDRAQTSAEILSASQTPARRKHVAALQRKRTRPWRRAARRVDPGVVLIDDTRIDQSKKGDAALRMCSPGHKHRGPCGNISDLQ